MLEGLSAGATVGLAVAGAAILTGLYLLKPRRRRVVVAFAPLWLPGAGERRSERWARRLRRWLSLALQAARVRAPAARGGRPAARRAPIARAAASSCSSTARRRCRRPTSPARASAPRARGARALVTGLGRADRALVASFAADVTAESGFETDARRLARAVDAVRPSEEPADLGRALAFAAAVLRGQPHPTLVLVSDGRFSDDARATPCAAGRDAADVRDAFARGRRRALGARRTARAQRRPARLRGAAPPRRPDLRRGRRDGAKLRRRARRR